MFFFLIKIKVKELNDWLKTNPQNKALFEAYLSTPALEQQTGPGGADPTPEELEHNAAQMLMTPSAARPTTQLSTSPGRKNDKPNCVTFSSVSALAQSQMVHYDIVCQLCAICDNKGFKFIIVWDGTKSK
jgi:hypothetical protein